MATRRNTKTQARRSNGNARSSGGGTSPVTIFVVGAALGAAVLFGAPRLLKESGSEGFLRPKPNADAEPASLATEQRVADGEGVVAKPDKTAVAAAEPTEKGTEFDFYNVLPNKEVDLTPEQQAAINQAEAQRVAQAQAHAARKAQADALAANTAASQAGASVQIMPDADDDGTAPALPKPVAVPVATKPVAPQAKPLPKPVIAVTPVKDRPVKAAAETAAQAPKPRAKAVAAYASNPDVTTAGKGAAMVMPAASAEAPAATGNKVLVQAGAYSDKDQAEKVKAKIAMLGLGARVESSTKDGKSVYRVRLGPYAENSTDLDAAKRKLSGGGLTAMEVHVN